MKRVAVILSGCGVFDGAEIHESVLTLLALDRANARAVCAAPDVLQHHVVNHLTRQPAQGETHNVLVESARIARGHIVPLSQLKVADVDAVILPGGFGAAKNLCNFAIKGAEATIQPEVARLLKEMAAAKKPIGAICIAPALIAATLGKEVHPQVTIGTDAGTAAAITATGSTHQDCPVREFVVDKANRIVTTPAYMLAESIGEAAEGIEKTVKAVLELI